ncbi:hypothetical protein FK216_01775 [Moraxellaceae bacterium AER2_44_116]|nr:hypothetical protein [Moraxellaceae bacterium]TQD00003.1 hypothetical protein FK216_01775 [Moraxellaceae bacterium AER2_44_116]
MFGVLKGFNGGLSELLKEEEERKALKARIDLVLESIKEQWLSGQIILDDLILVLAVSRAEKAEFRYSREYHVAQERDENIIPRIKKAVIENQLPIYNQDFDEQENDYVIRHNKFPIKTKLFKEDFLKWQQTYKKIAIPQRLIDLAVSENSKTKKTKIPEDVLMGLRTLLDEIRLRANEQGVNFDSNVMFGTKEQLHCLAKARFSGSLFEKAPTTFSDYLKNSNICKFRQGAKPSNIYEKLFPEYAAFFGARVSVVK